MMRSPKAIIAGSAAILVAALSAYWYTDAESRARDERRDVLREGIALFEQKKYPEALQELQAIPIDRTDDWRVPYYLGSTHMMLKDYAAAAGALERALEIKPDEAGTLYALGVVYYKLGNLKLAKAYFAAVLEINPNDQHAKGLMDIMANLEQQSVPEAPDPADDELDDQ